MSLYASNYRDRLDISYILYHTQKPLVNTKIAKYLHTDVLPCGENAVVMIGCYSGHNQDDSIVFNQTSIDRGLFRSTSLKKWGSKIEKNQSTSHDDIFMKPDITKLTGTRHAVYEKLNDKGFVPEETVIENGDVIIGKVTPIQPLPGSNKCFKDSSEIYKSQESAIIDKVFTGIYDSEGYEIIKIRTRSERIPKTGDKYCIPSSVDSDVLTSTGWKSIKEITKEDFVATLNDKGILNYEKPIDVYKFNYNGDIYKLRSQMVDLDVTIDHELYVKRRNKSNFELIPAKDVIGKRVNFKKDCINNNSDIEKFTLIKDKELDMNTWLKYFGIWYAEGWAGKYSNSCYQCTICQIKPRVREQIINIITNLGYNYSLHDNNEKITISNKDLCEYLSELSVGALNKSLPQWVWNLSQNQSKILLEYMILGDGSTNKNGSVCYYTSSTKLADDVMKLAIHSGWSGSIKTVRKAGYTTKINGRTITSKADALVVKINKTKNKPQINHGHVHQQNGQSEEIYNFNGEVYCLEVSTHVFMIRQNNKNVWIGNCSRHGLTSTRNRRLWICENPNIILN